MKPTREEVLKYAQQCVKEYGNGQWNYASLQMAEFLLKTDSVHVDKPLAASAVASGECGSVPDADEITTDQCIELEGALQKEWARKAIAETRVAASLLEHVEFRSGMETACDEIETRLGLTDQSGISSPSHRPNEKDVVAVPVQAYLWLMGLGADGFTQSRRGAFWWRSAFNERAGLDMMSIYESTKPQEGKQ